MILDHSDDKQVNDLFEKVKKDSKGQLDILVNNAYAGVDMIFSHSKNKFYELDPVEQWDTINGDWSWVEESFSMFYLCFKVHEIEVCENSFTKLTEDPKLGLTRNIKSSSFS